MTYLPVLLVLSSVAWAQVPSSQAISSSIARETAKRSASLGSTVGPGDLVPELPLLPPGKISMIGGTVSSLDRVRDQLTLRVFGGGKLRVLFDGRTRIYRDGLTGSPRDLKTGDHVYLDTMLDGTMVFARNIHILTGASSGESSGQLLRFDGGNGELTLRDSVSPQPVKVRLSAATAIVRDGHAVPASELRTGSLITVKFGPDRTGHDVAQEVSILAVPGASFTFAGRVTGLDMHTGLLVLVNPSDKKTYEVYFDPAAIPVNGDLKEGADVIVTTRFDGTRYVATAIEINSSVR